MLVPVLMPSLPALAGRETAKGFGKDQQGGGQAIDEASGDAQ
jgi:predicted small secreted protein